MKKYFRLPRVNFKNLVLAVAVMQMPTKLPKLQANPQLVTVSGVSSGGMLAEQMFIAASDRFLGAGIIAGGIYGCAEGDVDQAQGLCMKSPEKINVDRYLKIAADYEKKGLIAPLANLKNRRLFILHGTKDTVVHAEASQKLLEFSQKLMPAQNINTQFQVAAGHGFPTAKFGNSCATEGNPWINKCNYDSAGNLLQFLYQTRLKAGKLQEANLVKFDQSPFLTNDSSMGSEGYAYIPTKCQKPGSGCGLHVALHGCLQSPVYVQDAFITKTGYNDWAEANGIIILYPVARFSSGNPNACWDWWGYTGSNYLTRKAPQIQSIMKMVDYLIAK